MDEIERLGARYLVIRPGGEAVLAETLPRQDEMLCALSLRHAVRRLRPLVGAQRLFTPKHIEAVAGVSYHVVNRWVTAGLIAPVGREDGERMFDSTALFWAAVAGTLLRHGLRGPVLKAVADLLGTSNTPAEEPEEQLVGAN